VIPAQSLFTLINTDEWFAVANFREADLSAIAIGDFAGGVTGVPGRLLFGLQRAFTFCAFGLGALNLNRSVALDLLHAFGLTAFLPALSILDAFPARL
jgi:membrane fusion protein, multidrug efflux system